MFKHRGVTSAALMWLSVLAMVPPVTAYECDRWTYPHRKNPPPPNGLCSGQGDSLLCYWKSPQKACDAQVKEAEEAQSDPSVKPYVPLPVEPVPNNPDYYFCKHKWQGSNSIFTLVEVHLETIQPQSHCSLDIQGPYRSCSDRWFMRFILYQTERGWEARKASIWVDQRPLGAAFTDGQKKKIRRLNKNRHGELRSDLAGLYADETCTVLIDPAVDANNDCSAEVHHIVPQKDKHGCLCGRNSFKNALVISRKLNNKLTNDPRPQALLSALPQIAPYPCRIKNFPPGLQASEVLDFNAEADGLLPTEILPLTRIRQQ